MLSPEKGSQLKAAKIPKNGIPINSRDISAMFTRIAPRYDLLNRLMTGGLDHSWRRKTVGMLSLKNSIFDQKARFLDLATGTADLALALSHEIHKQNSAADFQIDGVDISSEMLGRGKAKIKALDLENQISLHEVSMEKLPFPDQTFDGAMMAFGIRNVPDRNLALSEIYRVLKPCAPLVILEALPPQNGFFRSLQRIHMFLSVRFLGSILSEGKAYKYLGDSVAKFPSPPAFMECMKGIGFKALEFRPLTCRMVGIFRGFRS
jgi:demethylmenaquinone methyltransferase/2-methoxy-6-polyprenyl-1,4-benzoquinol methylase